MTRLKLSSQTKFLIFVTLAVSASLALAHSHSHDHGHDHGHSHGAGGCPHAHSHDEGKAKWHKQKGLDEFGNEWVEAEAPKRERTLEETINLWWTAMGSTLLISAAPFFILFFVPLDAGEEHKPFLNVLLAFAAGGLLGDSFLHLIPHAIPPPGEGDHGHSHGHDHGGHGHTHNNDHINCNLWVLAGMLTFLFIEKWARIMNVGHSHGPDGHGHSHGAVASEKKDEKESPEAEKSDGKKSKGDEKVRNRKKTDKKGKKDADSASASESEGNSSEEKKKDDKKASTSENSDDNSSGFLPQMEVAGYLNLAADFCHNFTDGLAIGASYLAGNTVGMITTATILIHEVPHEIGDFAILINSGCPRMKAILLQSTTAIGALIGTALGLMMENFGADAINAILPFTAGGFIYIACCSIMPELLESKYNSFRQVFSEVFMMLLGIGLMVVIGWFE